MDKIGRLSPETKACGWKMLTSWCLPDRWMYITYTSTYFRVTEIDVVIYLLMIPPPQLAAAKAAAALLWAVAKAFSLS